MTEYETEFSEFPKEWEVKRLNELAKIIMGQSPPSSAYNDKGQGLPFIQGSKDFGDIYPSIKTFTTICKKIAPKDSILFSVRAPVGDINISDREICIGRGIAAIVPYNKTDLLYLYYYLTYSAFKIKRYSSGTTFESIKERDLENFQITLPPLDERKKIVKILNAVDFIITDTTNLIEKLRVIKEKALHLLITGSIWHKEFVKTDIGEFPKDWEVRRLNEIAIIRSGFSERKRDENSKVIHLRPDNIDNETDRIVFHRIVYIPESPKIERYLLRHLDIVLVNTNGSIDHIGKLGIIDMPLNQKITFSNHLTAIRIVSKDVEPYYIYYLLSWYHLNGSFKKVVKNQAGKWNLNLDTIRNLLIPLPPLEEQKKIVELLQKVDELIIRFNDFLQNLEDEANTLYKSILRLALTGKLTEHWRRQIILLRSVVIPYLVYQASKIKGRPVYMTELMKYLFLLQKEYNINLAYNFEPYKYGPFTPQLYKDLEELKDRIEVKEVKDNVDKSLITSKELPQVNQDIANAVNDLINRFGNKDLKELLSYVYKKYPEYTVKSELNLDEFLK